ncbi:DUF5342 family protein [Alkalicoccus urumqiensis]|uniref:YheE family protein n=1 Tax=Alkalicoccus urumqiensis TaxID=1548213 RepID=A0A2P6MEG4_ALKUR|nr:DUF5342 family protein [Alkalicoccus urumqiensis]PRO64651.1 hypothetical protein C6I21_13165 [Alkalicoccus urumqiensis]
MIQHFQWKAHRPSGWSFSFYHQGARYRGFYHRDGTIRWDQPETRPEKAETLEGQIHDLMLYHVYEDH